MEDPAMRKKLLLVVFTIFFLTLSACSGGTGGMVTGSRQSCKSSGGTAFCEGKINKLSGTVTHEAQTSNFRDGEAVLVEALFNIESGRLRISITAPDGTVTLREAAPGAPAELIGIATVDSSMDDNVTPLTLEALDGDVQGITFSIAVTLP